jgi:hypothetical protein
MKNDKQQKLCGIRLLCHQDLFGDENNHLPKGYCSLFIYLFIYLLIG